MAGRWCWLRHRWLEGFCMAGVRLRGSSHRHMRPRRVCSWWSLRPQPRILVKIAGRSCRQLRLQPIHSRWFNCSDWSRGGCWIASIVLNGPLILPEWLVGFIAFAHRHSTSCWICGSL